MTALLSVDGLTKHFPVTRGVLSRVVGHVRAVDGVSFEVGPGETLGLVGESGCGKTTVGRSVLRLLEPTSGRIVFDGSDITHATPRELSAMRRHLQIVFQDPYSSLNPRLRVSDIVGEALEVHGITRGAETEARVRDLLRKVGLSPAWINRYPHEFSGGQRQRIGIARAIATHPKLIVCDEAVSALDVSIQAQVLNLLVDLRREMNLAYLFIAHDLSVVRHLSHRVAVMYLGQIVELSPSKRLFEMPCHPYTRALLASVPVPAPRKEHRRLVLQGDVPSPLNPPGGCRFHTRCPAALPRCRDEDPKVVTLEPGHSVKCVHAEGLEGTDFRAELDARILAATADNVRHAPTMPPAAALHLDVKRPERKPRREAKANPRPVNGGAIAFATLAAFVTFSSMRHYLMRKSAEHTILRVSQELQARATITSDYPSQLSELGYRLYPIFDRGIPLDPWGNPLRYRAPGEGGRPFDLGSTGPDGVPSRDDIGHVPASDASRK